MIPASTWSSVDLPAPLGPMTASDSPWTSSNVTSRSAQNCVGRLAREQVAERLAEGRLLGEAQAVADAEVVDVDGVRRRGRRRDAEPIALATHRTFANAGSSRLKT